MKAYILVLNLIQILKVNKSEDLKITAENAASYREREVGALQDDN